MGEEDREGEREFNPIHMINGSLNNFHNVVVKVRLFRYLYLKMNKN